MKVSHSEGVANHTVPKSWLGGREAAWQALTGEDAGWVLSRESYPTGVPTPFPYTYRFGDKLTGIASNIPGETASVAYNYESLDRAMRIALSGDAARADARAGKRRFRNANGQYTWWRWDLGWNVVTQYADTNTDWTSVVAWSPDHATPTTAGLQSSLYSNWNRPLVKRRVSRPYHSGGRRPTVKRRVAVRRPRHNGEFCSAWNQVFTFALMSPIA